MYYSIKKTELVKLINPLQDNLFAHENITVQEIDDALQAGNIFPDSTLDLRSGHVCQTAFMVANPREIDIELFTDMQGKLQTTSPCALWAAIFSRDEVYVKFSDEEAFKLLQGVAVAEPAYEVKPSKLFNWASVVDMSQETWNSDEFVLNKIEHACKYSSMQELQEIFKFTPPEKWHSMELLGKIQAFNGSQYFFQNVPTALLVDSELFDHACETLEYELISRFIKLYKGICQFKKEQRTYYSFGDTIIGEFFKQKEKLSPSEVQRYQLLIEKEEKIFEQIPARLLDNENVAKLFIAKINGNLDDFSLFSRKITHDEAYIDLMLSKLKGANRIHSNPANIFPHHIFAKEKYQHAFLGLLHNIHLYGSDNVFFKLLSKNWIDDKEKILAYSKLTTITTERDGETQNPFVVFWDLLDKSMQKDVDIARTFMGMNYKLYNKLHEEARNNKELFILYCELGEDHKIGKVKATLLESLTEQEMQKVLRFVPELYLSPAFPPKYKDRADIVCYLGKIKDKLSVSQEIWQEVYSNPDYAKTLVSSHEALYNELPHAMQMNLEVAKAYLKKSYYLNYLPKQLFCSKEFCYFLLDTASKIGSQCIQHIPKGFFQERDFLLAVMAKVDDKQLSPSVLNDLHPKINELVHGCDLKVGQFHSFFEKAISNSLLKDELSQNSNSKKRSKL